jgi:DNA replication protein DnaC
MARIQNLSQNSNQTPKADNTKELLEKMQERGYPKRSCLRIGANELFGPALQKAKDLWPRVKGEDAILLLTGDRGPGKTQIASLWAFWRAQEGIPFGHYVKHADLMSEIKTTWGASGQKTESQILGKYRKAAYLVIDEIQEKGTSDWESRIAVNIIDHRYDNMLVTILIANYSEAEVAQHVNKSILSRCRETGGHVVCDWPSYRDLEELPKLRAA